jgi:hypothetical protein
MTGPLFLFSVLLDYAVDVERTEDRTCTLVIKDHDPITARRNVSVIDRRHGIFVTVRCANRKRDKWHTTESLFDLIDHGQKLH